MKVIRYPKESKLVKQDEYISEHGNMRELRLQPVQLGAISGFLDWQKETFPKVLEELEEAENLLEQMSSGNQDIDEKVRRAVRRAKIAVKVLVDSLEKY